MSVNECIDEIKLGKTCRTFTLAVRSDSALRKCWATIWWINSLLSVAVRLHVFNASFVNFVLSWNVVFLGYRHWYLRWSVIGYPPLPSIRLVRLLPKKTCSTTYCIVWNKPNSYSTVVIKHLNDSSVTTRTTVPLIGRIIKWLIWTFKLTCTSSFAKELFIYSLLFVQDCIARRLLAFGHT